MEVEDLSDAVILLAFVVLALVVCGTCILLQFSIL